MKASDYKTVASEIVFSGHIFSVAGERVAYPDGAERVREVITHPGAAGAVALTAAGEVILVRQYRPATREVILEIPAGLSAAGEDPEECVRRELLEEVGAVAGELVRLSSFYTTPGCSNERFHLYLAEDVSLGEPSPEEDEELEVVVLPLEEALRRVESGEIADAKTIIGLLMAQTHLSAG